MSLELPTFRGSHCKFLTLCGQLHTSDKVIINWVSKQKTLVTSYEDRRKTVLLRSMMGGKSGKHVHVDVARSDYFRNDDAPKAKQPLQAFHKRFDRLLGLEIAIGFIAAFEVKMNELPERGMVRSMAIETRTGELTIKMEGGKYSLAGAPITGVQWSRVKDSDVFRIRIEGQRSVKIGAGYLVDQFSWAEQMLSTFILGR